MPPKFRQTGRKLFDHELPPWVDADAPDFFITVCCQQRGTNQLCLPEIGHALMASARFYAEQRRWFPWLFLLMPDHLHMLVGFARDQDMNKVVSAWKRYTATQHHIIWQQGFFEHRLRRNESYDEKARYILANPVRAGLVEKVEEWPFLLEMREG